MSFDQWLLPKTPKDDETGGRWEYENASNKVQLEVCLSFMDSAGDYVLFDEWKDGAEDGKPKVGEHLDLVKRYCEQLEKFWNWLD